MTTEDFQNRVTDIKRRDPLRSGGRVIPRLVCRDGTSLSVQASCGHYCSPRDNEGPWSLFEVGFVERADGSRLRVRSFGKSDSGVYGWVPASKLAAFIKRHGGIISE